MTVLFSGESRGADPEGCIPSPLPDLVQVAIVRRHSADVYTSPIHGPNKDTCKTEYANSTSAWDFEKSMEV